MRISVKAGAPEESKAALLAIAMGGGNARRSTPNSLSRLDRLLKGEIGRLLATHDFTGAQEETALFYPASGPKRVLLVGLGERDTIDGNAVRQAAALAARRATELGARSLGFYLAPESADLDAELVGRVVAEGAGQGGWTYEHLRSKRESKGDLNSVTVVIKPDQRLAAQRGRRIGAAVAAGQSLARDLQMRPGNECTPSELARQAQELGKRHGFKVTVKGKRQIESEGLNALLAVAQGSAQEPRFITLEYRGRGGGAVNRSASSGRA